MTLTWMTIYLLVDSILVSVYGKSTHRMEIRGMSDSKNCFKCGELKPLSMFYKHKQMKDGRVNKCKECNKADVSGNYRANIYHYKKYEKSRATLSHRVKARADYTKTDEGKAAGSKAKKAWRERNAVKNGASIIVGNAVRDGRLIKPDYCESCRNKPNRLHGHHDNYAFALQVRWLCPGCHTKWHKENGPGINGESTLNLSDGTLTNE